MPLLCYGCGVFTITLCALICVTWVFSCRWGLRVFSDSGWRGQQAHNFRQLETGELLTASFTPQSLCLFHTVYTDCLSFCAPLTSFYLSKPPFNPAHEKNGKSHLFNFCDGQIICAYSSVKRVCTYFIFYVHECVCLCAALYGESFRSSCAHCTRAFWSSLIRKSGNHSLC